MLFDKTPLFSSNDFLYQMEIGESNLRYQEVSSRLSLLWYHFRYYSDELNKVFATLDPKIDIVALKDNFTQIAAYEQSLKVSEESRQSLLTEIKDYIYKCESLKISLAQSQKQLLESLTLKESLEARCILLEKQLDSVEHAVQEHARKVHYVPWMALIADAARTPYIGFVLQCGRKPNTSSTGSQCTINEPLNSSSNLSVDAESIIAPAKKDVMPAEIGEILRTNAALSAEVLDLRLKMNEHVHPSDEPKASQMWREEALKALRLAKEWKERAECSGYKVDQLEREKKDLAQFQYMKYVGMVQDHAESVGEYSVLAAKYDALRKENEGLRSKMSEQNEVTRSIQEALRACEEGMRSTEVTLEACKNKYTASELTNYSLRKEIEIMKGEKEQVMRWIHENMHSTYPT